MEEDGELLSNGDRVLVRQGAKTYRGDGGDGCTIL